MKLKNIFFKSAISLISIITILVFSNVTNAIRTDNEVSDNQMSTRTVTSNETENTNTTEESDIMPINEEAEEVAVEENMVLELGSIQIDKYDGNREITIPVKVTNASSICGGTLAMEHFGLQFVGVENENSNFMFSTETNEMEAKTVTTFFSSNGYNGDMDVINLKFNLPEEIEDNTYFSITFAGETSLITLNTTTDGYTLNNAGITIVKGNVSNSSTLKIVLIVGIAVIVILLLAIIIKKAKRK